MTGQQKMRMNIHVRMNAFIIVCSCLCLTFTGKNILWNAPEIVLHKLILRFQDKFDKTEIKLKLFPFI